MTNEELLLYTGPDALLDNMDRQRVFILRRLATRMPCPNCAHEQSWFEGKRIAINDHDVRMMADSAATCSNCGRGLIYTAPLVSASHVGWHWTLVPIKVTKPA